jgi:hypothetical protein
MGGKGLMSRKKKTHKHQDHRPRRRQRHKEAQPYVQNTALLCSNT